MRVLVIQGDITLRAFGAIVNAANAGVLAGPRREAAYQLIGSCKAVLRHSESQFGV